VGLGFQLENDPDTVRAPDVCFIRPDRLPASDLRGYFRGAPDLAAEVVSPDVRYSDVAAKVEDYLAAGTRMVVVVDPARRTVMVHRSPADVAVLREGDVLDAGDVVPGWSLPVSRIFE
jgi:Uma2 family endonuclease